MSGNEIECDYINIFHTSELTSTGSKWKISSTQLKHVVKCIIFLLLIHNFVQLFFKTLSSFTVEPNMFFHYLFHYQKLINVLEVQFKLSNLFRHTGIYTCMHTFTFSNYKFKLKKYNNEITCSILEPCHNERFYDGILYVLSTIIRGFFRTNRQIRITQWVNHARGRTLFATGLKLLKFLRKGVWSSESMTPSAE